MRDPNVREAPTIELEEQMEPLLPAWRALAERIEPSPFLHPDWFLAWWKAFGEPGRLRVLTARRDGELVGVLPIKVAGPQILSPTNPHSDLYGITAEPTAREPLYAALFGLRPRRVELRFIEPTRPDLAALDAAAGGYRVIVSPLLESPVIPAGPTWDEYWASRSGKLRSNIRRLRRRLEEGGEIAFELGGAGERLDQMLDEGFAIEASGWKGSDGTAISSQTDTLRFYRETAAWADGRGILRLGFIRLDGRPIAFSYGLETDDAQYLLKLGADPEFAKAGLGTLMVAEMVEHGVRAGLRTEFMGNPDDYKLRWADAMRSTVRVRAFAPTPTGRSSWLIQTHGRRLAKKVLRRG